MCGHHGCWGTLPNSDGRRWCCFSANHGADSGDAGLMGDKVWHGDALDIAAHERGMSRLDVLCADGYWGTRPVIFVAADDMAEVADDIMGALSGAADLYTRDGEIVEAARHGDGYRIAPLGPYRLRELAQRQARFRRYNASKETWVACTSPDWLVKAIRERAAYPDLRELRGVIPAPTLRRDRSLLTTAGYDKASGLIFAPNANYPSIPSQPTPADVAHAVDALVEPFADFPFVQPHHLAACIATVLAIVARPAIDGPVPLLGISATAPGSGKSLCADVISLITTGAPASRTTVPDSDEEMRKKITSFAIADQPVVLLDNIEATLKSESLAGALTSRTWADRKLGGNDMYNGELRAVFIATGNGLRYGGDLGRRVLPVEMDAGMDHPEDRSGFRYPVLLDFVRGVRPALVSAALTILRAFVDAGAPQHGAPPMGSFERWDDLIRSSVVWAGLDDPCAGRRALRDQSDDDRDTLGGLLTAWSARFGSTPTTLAKAVATGQPTQAPDLWTAFRQAVKTGAHVDAVSLGAALRKFRGRVIDGRRFSIAGRTGGSARWFVEEIADDGGTGSNGGGEVATS